MLGMHLIRKWWSENANSPALVPIPRSCYCTSKAWGKVSTHTVLGWWRERRAWAGPPKATERPRGLFRKNRLWAFCVLTGSKLPTPLPPTWILSLISSKRRLPPRIDLSFREPRDVPGTHYTWGALPPERALRLPSMAELQPVWFCPVSRVGGELWEAPRH